MRTLVLYLFFSLVPNSYAANENWWVFHGEKNKCMPAGVVSPENIMNLNPECEIARYDEGTGILILNCEKAPQLKNFFVFGNGLGPCQKAKELLEKTDKK